jgi:hypothetical protein
MSHKTSIEIWRGIIRSLSHWYFCIRVSTFFTNKWQLRQLDKTPEQDWRTRLTPGCRQGFFSLSPLCLKWHSAAACASCLPHGGKAVGIRRLLIVPRCRMHGDWPALLLVPSRCVAEAQGNRWLHTKWNQGCVGCVLMFRQQNAGQIQNIKAASNTSFENVTLLKCVGTTQVIISFAKKFRTD